VLKIIMAWERDWYGHFRIDGEAECLWLVSKKLFKVWACISRLQELGMARENLWLVKCADRDGDDVDDLRK